MPDTPRPGRSRNRLRMTSLRTACLCAARMLALVVAAAAIPSPLLAQSSHAAKAAELRATGIRTAEMRATSALARAVRASQRYQVLSARYDSRVADRDRSATRDSVRAGNITILVTGPDLSRDDRAALVAGADAAWRAIAALRDSTVASAVAAEPLALSVFPKFGLRGPLGRNEFMIGIPHPMARQEPLGGPLKRTSVGDRILDLFGSTVGARVSGRTASWLGGPWVPLQPMSRKEWQAVRTSLATSRSSMARDCLGGAVPSCLAAFELVRPPADPLGAWYSANDRVALIAEWNPPDSAGQERRATCIAAGTEAACAAAAARIRVPRPLPTEAHRALLSLAIERGGPNALGRFLDAPDDVAAALAAAAGESIDTLISALRDRVAATPPERTMPDTSDALTMLGWTGLFGVLAMRRKR